MVRSVDYIPVVLHNHDGVAQVAELLHNFDQPRGISRVQSDARLVENIKGAYQAAAQGTDKINPLALSAA